MTNNEKINNYVRFFRDQKREVESAYGYILDSPVSMLLKDGVLNVGTIVAASTKSGNITIKLHKGYTPRLKMMRSFGIVTKSAKAAFGDNIIEWDIPFRTFHDGQGYRMGESDIMPLYFRKSSDSKYDFIVCGSVEQDMFDFINKCINSRSQYITVLLYDPYPPTEYFENLAYYTHTHRDCKDLLLEPTVIYDDWCPEELAYSPNQPTLISDTISNTLYEEGCCILQGPPGTGKSYTIASIVANYLNHGKSVCVTTMANSGLVELAKQSPLSQALGAGKIFKTSLKADEKKAVSGIQSAQSNLVIPSNSALLTTYYKLSSVVGVSNNDRISDGMFDLIVIEEASQAFLSTIVAFRSLGKECLIVGDPMQLPPIVQGLGDKPEYKIWKADIQCNGMSAFAMGTNIKSYRIVTTFRLTPRSANLTKIFYSNKFHSVKKDYVDFKDLDEKYFPKGGGVLYKFISGFVDQNYNIRSLNFIGELIQTLEKHCPDTSLAIISPFRETVKKLQSEFQTDKRVLKDFTIETIDRIQGMTVDYAILYLPAGGSSFALDERRFNVATSRSLSTPIIVTDVELERLAKFKGKVRSFIQATKQID